MYQIIEHKYGRYVIGTIPVSEFVALLKAWGKEGFDFMVPGIAVALGANTAVCSQPNIPLWEAEINEEAQRQYAGSPALIWRHSTDMGMSSLAIYSAFIGGSSRGETPRDEADFGRCHRLLKAVPAWRERLDEVGERFPQWQPLIAKWRLLEKMYENNDHDGIRQVLAGAK